MSGINLHIPPEKQMSVIINLLIENLATSFALQDFIFIKLMDMSNITIDDKFKGFIENQKKQIEQFKVEISASLMSKYSE